jgi:hypothetical protein
MNAITQPNLTGLHLPLAVYRFELRCENSGVMPGYAGSALRGAFGHALRNLACMTKAKTCDGCMLKSTCPYPALFESSKPEPTLSVRGKDAPNPYVIQTEFHARPWMIEAGQLWHFDMVLTGMALPQLPLIVYAWQKALARGLTTRDIRFTLLAVRCLDQITLDDDPVWTADEPAIQAHLPGVLLPEGPNEGRCLRINLQSPVRIQARRTLVYPDQFQLSDWIRALVRRFEAMADCHMPTVTLRWDLLALLDAVEHTTVQHNLHWQHWTRHSSRQQQSMDLDGLMGYIEITGDWFSLWPLLYIGQWLHVGKNASFGLGAYHLHTTL